MFNKCKNLITFGLYSFKLLEIDSKQTVLKPGDKLRINGTIKNDGYRLGTVYLIIKLANPYNHKVELVNTDRDFDTSKKQALRLVDICVGEQRIFGCEVELPSTLDWGILDIKVEIWTPAMLFEKSKKYYYPFSFFESNWRGFVEIIKPKFMISNVFISYSWQSEEHQRWVFQLSEELSKYSIETVLDQKDLFAGEEATLFMEENSTIPKICLLVCSSTYVLKANNRERGVGYEVSILAREILDGRKRFTLIPIIRDNKEKNIPKFLGSQVYIDMDNEHWKSKPMLDLVRAIEHINAKL